MKKITLFITTLMVSVSSWSACNYNFDLTQAALDQGGGSDKVFPIRQGQKLAYNISNKEAGFVASSLQYATQNEPNQQSVKPGDKVIPSKGIVAFEYSLKVPSAVLSGQEGLMSFPIIADTTVGTQRAVAMYFGYFNNLGNFTNGHAFLIGVGNNYSEVLPVVSTTNGYQRFGLYLNQDTKKVGLIVNGVNKGYVESFTNNPSAIAFIIGSGHTALAANSPIINQQVSIELVTDKNQLQFTYPTGTKDICGNVI